MEELDMKFFFNLKVVAATATTSINHIRDCKCKYRADLSPACTARWGRGGGIKGFLMFPQQQAHIHTQVFKKKKK